jgi:hypothetical protein
MAGPVGLGLSVLLAERAWPDDELRMNEPERPHKSRLAYAEAFEPSVE